MAVTSMTDEGLCRDNSKLRPDVFQGIAYIIYVLFIIFVGVD